MRTFGNTTCRVLAAALVMGWIGFIPRNACAQVTVYDTGFEAPEWAAGQPVSGQNGWEAGNGGTIGPLAGVISTSNPKSGSQSLKVSGSDLVYVASDGLFEGVYRPAAGVDTSGWNFLRISADVRLDGPLSGNTPADDDYSANVNVYNATEGLAEIYLSSNGMVVYDDGTSNWVYGPTVDLGVYHHLAIDMYLSGLYSNFFIDGKYLGTLSIPGSIATDKTVAVNLANLAYADFPGFRHSDYTSNFDNYQISASTPEPGTLALVSVFGMAGLAAIRQRRSKSIQ